MKIVKIFKAALRQALSMFVVIGRVLFNKHCPECLGFNTKTECYSGNPYAKNGKWKTGRQCYSCGKFWFS
jgi:hypothetical protein